MRKQGSGWHGESRKHAMAARGIPTKRTPPSKEPISPVTTAIETWMDELERTEGFYVAPYVVNCGLCGELAEYVEEHVPGAESFWLEDRYPETHAELFHCLIEYKGKFYDAETPQGVDNIEDLPIVKHTGDTDYHETMHERCQWGVERMQDWE